jgi:U3 small nucleolar RNA-associated protein 19
MASLTDTKVVEKLVDGVVSALELETHTDNHVQSLLSAHRLFMSFHQDGTLSAAKKQKKKSKKTSAAAASLASYQTYVAGQYRLFLTATLEWLHFDHPRCQVTALRCLLKHCAPPLESRLDEALLEKTVVALMTDGRTSIELLAILLTEVVLKYGDVAFVTLRALRRSMLSSSKKEDGADDEDDEDSTADLIDVAHNVHAVLSRMPMPPSSAVLARSMVQGETSAEEETTLHWSDRGEHTKAYGLCWSAVLSVPGLSQAMYVKMLSQLPNMVLPHMTNPLILSDFLTDSYALGGEASLLALDGLWYLIKYHQFDCPEFFTKLYALLEPAAFHSVYRERLFEKVSMFLKSTGLSTHVISAWVKRIARRCLNAPPDGILYALPLVFRLITTHPTCVVLLHRNDEEGQGLTEDVVSDDDREEEEEEDGDKDMVDVSEMSDEDATRWRGRDTFRAGETNPEKSGALGSSLWEIAALQDHYHPSVATIAKRFNRKLMEADVVEDFTGQSYDSLFNESMSRKVRRVALEFRRPANFYVGR